MARLGDIGTSRRQVRAELVRPRQSASGRVGEIVCVELQNEDFQLRITRRPLGRQQRAEPSSSSSLSLKGALTEPTSWRREAKLRSHPSGPWRRASMQ